MSSNKENLKTVDQKPTRLKPGIIIAIVQWIVWFVVPKFMTGGPAIAISVFGGLLCGLAIIVWWAFFSRATPKRKRWVAPILMIVLLIVIPQFTNESIKTGLAGMMFFVYAVPVLTISFVLWAVISQYLPEKLQYVTMALTILISCGMWTLVRSDGISGAASAQLSWRWAQTSEERLLLQSEDVLTGLTTVKETGASWSGFRGANRDGIIHDLKIETDWKATPPVEMWRKPIGPGCSSFAVRGELMFTQEQRGEDEMVSCYNITTGEPIWRHSDKVRFWDSHAGAGPRGTPTLQDSLVFTLGATGILNVLNINDGSLVWSRNTAKDIKLELPGWGIASSPLVVDDVVIVAVSGTVVAYDIETSEPRWFGPDGGENYSSPHLVTIDGVKQVIMMSVEVTSSFEPGTGKLFWEDSLAGSIVQPAITTDGDILISEGYKKGIHRIAVSHNNGDWTLEELWMTAKIRPDFNDFVIHKNHIYGFEGHSITCIDLSDGSRKWKSGRYGGQILLIADQDLLLVLTEKGELVLGEVSPEKFTEIAKISAIKGKTWNHPVIVDDILLVRNTQEMVAYRLKKS